MEARIRFETLATWNSLGHFLPCRWMLSCVVVVAPFILDHWLTPFLTRNSVNSSFTALSNVTNGVSVIFSNQKPPVKCAWSPITSNKPLTGQWSSFFTCNGTVHKSHATSVLVKSGAGFDVGMISAVVCWIGLYWIWEL